jgi:hypothetical protein
VIVFLPILIAACFLLPNRDVAVALIAELAGHAMAMSRVARVQEKHFAEHQAVAPSSRRKEYRKRSSRLEVRFGRWFNYTTESERSD